MAKRPHRVFEMYDFREEAIRALTPKSAAPVEEAPTPEPWSSEHLKVSHSANVTIVNFHNSQSFGDETRTEFRQQLSQLADTLSGDSKVLLDFTGVKSFSAASIDLLVQLNQNLRHKGSRLMLCCLEPEMRESFFVARTP